ncbi:tetratricopeptide repeat protein [Salegentibacter salinarum]|uniref:Tetratricopeptide repeat protein n=1 Tax=Salegentibacter salinarum TaxID=447422 RepID=A0A2N0U3E9_9FLAO|nr:tetratricopeptide repeat protein [Salegentibacter salinarum]PKD21523.1 tetratricopeptide repeat protein [Salegentibacter salinarum]SKB37217.1 TPR repeat-containing protein [Salegentibacter salinarum]
MRYFYSIILCSLFIFNSVNAQNNEELQKMADADQEERMSGTDWKTINTNDSIRLAKVTQMFKDRNLNTAKDYFNAGIIFQHGRDTLASGRAVKTFKKAIEIDSTLNRWWYAAAVDRDLMRRGEPQIYGTQHVLDSEGNPVKYKMDTTRVSDAERKYYRVPSLAQQRENDRLRGLKQVSSFYAENSDINKTISLIESQFKKGDESEYNVSENTINSFGYQLISENKLEEALKVLQLNTELYPEASNPWDSYGEILLKLGREKAAIKAYQKSLELDPNNENAIKVLEGSE